MGMTPRRIDYRKPRGTFLVYLTERNFCWTNNTRKDLTLSPTPSPGRESSSPQVRMSSDKTPWRRPGLSKTHYIPVVSQCCLSRAGWWMVSTSHISQAKYNTPVGIDGCVYRNGTENDNRTGTNFEKWHIHVYTELHLLEVFSCVSFQLVAIVTLRSRAGII